MPASNAPAPSLRVGFGTPFDEQIEFFRQKLNLPTDRWDDVKRSGHDRAFIVAGAAKADLLQDLRAAVARAIEEGRGIEAFRKDFREIVKKHGWTGWTGEGTKAGEAWRTRVIYQTNMATSYAAGRYRQLTDPDFLRLRPYWRYVHSDSVLHPRPHHKHWGDMRLTLRHDHPFWQTHFPPNGWGCRCRVVPVAAPEADAATAPPDGWDDTNPKTGAPLGIDKGFDYQPGASVDMPLREMVSNKLINYPPAIASALTRDVNRWIDARTNVAEFAVEALANTQFSKDLWLGFVDAARLQPVAKDDLTGYLVLLRADGIRHTERTHQFDGGTQRAPRAADYADAARWLNEGEVLPGKSVDGHQRLIVRWASPEETIESIWEIRPGKRNRSLTFISMRIKRETEGDGGLQ